MNNLKLLVGTFLLFFIGFNSTAQSIENLTSNFNGENITISYDLVYENPNQKFTINIFSSHNNFQKPLTLVSGDYGENILPGRGKKIIWDVKNELPPNFNDNISFKIKATFIVIEELKILPLTSNAFKRGKNIELKWKGGNEGENIKIELLRNNVLQESIAQTTNSGKYTWVIPKKQKTGSNYAIRIRNVDNTEQNTSSAFFKIKPRTPLLLKFGIPVAVVIVAVLAGGSSGGSDSTNGQNELPGPITP